MSAPPAYTDEPRAAPSTTKYGAVNGDASAEPLLSGTRTSGEHASGSTGVGRNAWTDQPSSDDLPDDFKVGVTVIDCDAEIRVAFIRKVYAILFAQLLTTSIVAACMSLPAAVEFTHENPWIIWIPMIGSFVSLMGVYWKRHDHPANFIMLGVFTALEAVMIGAITSHYESRIVLQALFITLGIFAGLTLFTFQTKYDFSSWAPYLFTAIWGLIMTSFVAIFLPFNANVDLAIAGFSVLIFSGFILYDTQQIMKRLSIDEYILGALSLYLDAINLFLSVLRVLNNAENR